MEEIRTPRLPSLNQGFHVGGIPAEREPPEKSWARIRTCLIDNPKDEGLQRRQETWTYQQKNRGVLKSLMKTLPNVPYRVKKETKENLKRSLALAGHSEDRRIKIPNNNIGREGKIRLPKLSRNDSPSRKPQRLLGELNHGATPEEMDERVKQRLEYQYESPDGSSVNISDKQNKHPKLPKISNPILQSYNNHKGNKLLKSKNVSFSLNDLPSIDRRIEMRPSSESSSSSSAVSDGILESYGPSSQTLTDLPHSVMDILCGNHFSNPRTLGTSHRQKYQDWERTRTPKKKVKRIPESDTDKQWLKRMVGDKEVISLSGYDNYARTKPLSDHYYSTVPYPPKRLPEKLGSLRKPLENKNSIYSTPRNNASVLAKSSPVGNIKQPTNRVPPVTKSPLGPIKSPPIGQNIASKSPMGNSPGSHYFPVFTGDGGPVRKIGGPKKKLKSLPNTNNFGQFVHGTPPDVGNMDPLVSVPSPVRSQPSTVSPHFSNPSTAMSSRVNSPPNFGGKTGSSLGSNPVLSKANSTQGSV